MGVCPGSERHPQSGPACGLTAGHEPLHVERRRTRVTFALDASPQLLAALAQRGSLPRGQAAHLLGFPFGEERLVEVPDREGRQDPPPDVLEQRFVERDETIHVADTPELGAPGLARQFARQLLVLELGGGRPVHEIARRDPPARPDQRDERRKRVVRQPLLDIQLVEEPRRVNEVERVLLERRPEDVASDEADRGGELRVSEEFAARFDLFGVGVEGGEGAALSDALAEALEPERRGAASVEDIEAGYVPQQVQLAVGEGDQIVLLLLARERITVTW